MWRTQGILGVTAIVLFSAATAVAPTGPPSDDPRPIAALPSTALGGDIEVTSYGVSRVVADDGTTLPVLQVRETFANRTDNVPWAIELASAVVSTGDGAPMHPVLVNSDLATLPIAIVGRAQRRTVDLYFPVSPTVAAPDALTAFDFTFRIAVAGRRYEKTLQLARTARAAGAQPQDNAPALGWGDHWWADATYPWRASTRRAGIMVPLPPAHVTFIAPSTGWFTERAAAADVDDDWPRTDECNEW